LKWLRIAAQKILVLCAVGRPRNGGASTIDGDVPAPCPCMHADVGKVLVVKPRVLLSFVCKGSNEAWILLSCACSTTTTGLQLKAEKVELEFTLYSQVRKNSETDSNGVAASLLDYLVDKKIKLF
jgi:hypothetical protein